MQLIFVFWNENYYNAFIATLIGRSNKDESSYIIVTYSCGEESPAEVENYMKIIQCHEVFDFKSNFWGK